MKDELVKIYESLPTTERLALDETIQQADIFDFDSLLAIFRQVETYLKEQ